MTIIVTPQPDGAPPRVRIDASVDVAGASFTELTIYRDGKRIRELPYIGSGDAVGFDYEAPFGVPVTYTVTGEFLPMVVADWSESWTNLANWTGDTGSFTTSGGKARSAVAGAKIVRAATGTIQRVSVSEPSFMRVELLDAANALVASVEVGSSVVLTGVATEAVSGSGSFAATLSAGVMSVSASNGSWSASVSYAGTPTRVRLVSLGMSYVSGVAFEGFEGMFGVTVDGSGNVYVTDTYNQRVRKFNPSGAQTLSFSTGGSPLGVAVDGSGNIYVADDESNTVRKFNPSGAQTLSFSTTGSPEDVAVDGSGNIYVTDYDNSLLRKFNPSGAQTLSFSTTGRPWGVAVDGSGNIYVTDFDNRLLRKFNPSGTQTLSFSTTGRPMAVALDAAGNIYVADNSNTLVRKFNASGTQLLSFSTTGWPRGMDLDPAGNVFVVDLQNEVPRKFTAITPSVGKIVETPAVTAQDFEASATTTLDVAEAWLIHPTFPTLSQSIDPGQHRFRDVGINVDGTTKMSKTRAARGTRHDPIGRRKAVFITTGPRAAAEWELKLRVRSLAARNDVESLVDDQSPLLLRSPPSWPWDLPDDWYAVGDYSEDRPRPRLDSPDRVITLPMVPVDEPIVRGGAVWTYGTDFLANPTYADSRAAFPTYLDRLVGPA